MIFETGQGRYASGSGWWRRSSVLAFATLISAYVLSTQPTLAHVSEQGLVLLLPKSVYIFSGVAAVILTVLALALLPDQVARGLATCWHPIKTRFARGQNYTSLAATMLLATLLFIGLTGSHDPLANPLPLFVWTLWWIGFLPAQALIGDFWRWVNPWAGAYQSLFGRLEEPGLYRLPKWLGCWPAVISYLMFILFMLADPAPENPARLAVIISGYWLYSFCGMILFGGRTWLERGEPFSVLMALITRIAIFGSRDGQFGFGIPGWQIQSTKALSISGGCFVLIVLGSGSFDGLNETFWWFGHIGVNPLEFPGRTAVIWPNVIGVVASNLILIAIFALCIYSGLWLIKETAQFKTAFGSFAASIIPIAVGYHISHYLPSFLVNIQYTLAAASDPMSNGADYLHLGQFYVTTGFFNTLATVKIIWLTQASAVVGGHVLAVLISHASALKMFGNNRKAVIVQMPLITFMVIYTLFGLWLLSTPR